MASLPPGVESTLKAVGVGLALGLYAITLAWGYQHRQDARAWKQVACDHRLNEIETARRWVARKGAADPCEALAQLGVSPVALRGNR